MLVVTRAEATEIACVQLGRHSTHQTVSLVISTSMTGLPPAVGAIVALARPGGPGQEEAESFVQGRARRLAKLGVNVVCIRALVLRCCGGRGPRLRPYTRCCPCCTSPECPSPANEMHFLLLTWPLRSRRSMMRPQ